MKNGNSSIEVNPNLKMSDGYYWNYDTVNNELNKFINERETFYKKNGFSYYKYAVSVEPTTFTEKDLRKSSKNMQALYDKFNKLQDDKVVDMFKGFFDLFLRNPSVYTLLSDLVDIYNSDLKAVKSGYKNGYKVKMENNEKIKLLERSFDIFKHLLNRDEILETIIRDKREKLSNMLLNEDEFLHYLKNHSELLVVNKKQQAMDSIFQQLKGNQR